MIIILIMCLFFRPKEKPPEPKGYYLTNIQEEPPERCSILAESYKEYKASIKVEKVKHKVKQVNKNIKKVKKVKKVNSNEVYLLAKLIYCEVGTIKNDECLYLCGSVVLNRINDKRYPNTMQEVIFQPGQYEVTWNGHWQQKTPDKRSLKIARKLLENGTFESRVMGMSERWWGIHYKQFNNVKFSIF